MKTPNWTAASWTFIKFNLVGVINTLVDMLVFALCIWFGAYVLIAQCMAYICGTANSFVWNKFWTFRSLGQFSSLQFFKFLTVNTATLLISLLALYIIQPYFSLLFSKVIVTLFTMIFNFSGNRYWVFKRRG